MSQNICSLVFCCTLSELPLSFFCVLQCFATNTYTVIILLQILTYISCSIRLAVDKFSLHFHGFFFRDKIPIVNLQSIICSHFQSILFILFHDFTINIHFLKSIFFLYFSLIYSLCFKKKSRLTSTSNDYKINNLIFFINHKCLIENLKSQRYNCQMCTKYARCCFLRKWWMCNEKYFFRAERMTHSVNTTNAGNRLTSKATEPNDFVLVKVVLSVLCARGRRWWVDGTARNIRFDLLCFVLLMHTDDSNEGNLLVYCKYHPSIVCYPVVHKVYDSNSFVVSSNEMRFFFINIFHSR